MWTSSSANIYDFFSNFENQLKSTDFNSSLEFSNYAGNGLTFPLRPVLTDTCRSGSISSSSDGHIDGQLCHQTRDFVPFYFVMSIAVALI